MINRFFTAMVLPMALCACVTTSPAVNGAADGGAVNLANDETGAQGLRPIANAALPDKSCGMVLWSLEGNRPAAIFKFVSGKTAQINIAGRPVELTRTSFDGASGFGIFEHQSFASTDGLVIDVNARFGLGFDGGAYLEQGLVKVSDVNGWSMVSPAAGIAGCRD